MNVHIDQALILAAGRGTRMGALTEDRPKPMLPIQRRPMLEYILTGLRGAGIINITLVVGYKEEVVREYFGDGSKFGLQVSYIQQDPARYGNGAAIHCAKTAMKPEPFFLGFGDILVDPNEYKRKIADYQSSPCDLFITLVEMGDVSSGSSVQLDKNGNVKNIVEKPPPGTATSRLNCAGLFVSRAILFDYIANVQPSKRGEYEFADAIQAMAHDPNRTVRGRIIQSHWADIANPEALTAAEARMKRQDMD